MKKYKLGEFASIIGVHPKTVQRWDREHFFHAKRTKTNRRYFTETDVRYVQELLNNRDS